MTVIVGWVEEPKPNNQKFIVVIVAWVESRKNFESTDLRNVIIFGLLLKVY
ncbi:hypothetical protein [Dapis sp. BLCC M126]|uniref:hypothetical protein n=1 Tax=Dapis sp. BLCC M126 TaxID=3400189 RepID=UPI003CF5D1DA